VRILDERSEALVERERGYLELIRDWGKKILLVINKADLLADDEKWEEERSFVDGRIRSALGLTPPIFFVSSLLARRASRRPEGGDLRPRRRTARLHLNTAPLPL
jgi:hypothetical protein